MLSKPNCIWTDTNSPRIKRFWRSYLCNLRPRRMSQSKKKRKHNWYSRVSKLLCNKLLSNKHNFSTSHLNSSKCQARCQLTWPWPLPSLPLCNFQRAQRGKKPTMRSTTHIKPKRIKVWNTPADMKFKSIMKKSFKLLAESSVPKVPTWRESLRSAAKVSIRPSIPTRLSSWG